MQQPFHWILGTRDAYLTQATSNVGGPIDKVWDGSDARQVRSGTPP
jgi:hypothetical protein